MGQAKDFLRPFWPFTSQINYAIIFFNIQAYAKIQLKYRQVSRALRCRGEKGSGVRIPRGAAAVLAWPLYDATVRMPYGKAKLAHKPQSEDLPVRLQPLPNTSAAGQN